MRMIKVWHCEAWDEYLAWHDHDEAKWSKINDLIEAIERDPFRGIGQPEPLKHQSGTWSRRIDQRHRLIYRVRDAGGHRFLDILRCYGHYK